MGNEKFCIVYSKPEKGTTPDTILYKKNIKKKELSGSKILQEKEQVTTPFLSGESEEVSLQMKIKLNCIYSF